MAASRARPGSEPRIRVLIADDSAVFRLTLAQMLAQSPGLAVVALATNGREAVREFARHQPDLAILDVGMPGVNGLEAAAELRRLSSELRIVLVSIHQDGWTEADCLRHGGDGFVAKIGIHRHIWREIERLFPGVTARSAQ